MNIKTITSIACILLSGSLLGQKNFDNYYFRDISIDYGIFNSLSSGRNNPEQYGSLLSLKTSHYLSKHLGYRTGFNMVNDLEGSRTLYSVPLYLSYRSKTSKSLNVSSQTHGLKDLILQLALCLFPQNAEAYIGPNIGATLPTQGQANIVIEGNEYKHSFVLKNNFFTSIDAGLKLNYKIWRLGIVLSPTVSYVVTNNYQFKSELPEYEANDYIPKWFIGATIGLSFAF